MEKNDWYKLFAIGIVLVFVLEGIAIGVMQNDNQPSSNQQVEGTASLTGNVNTNVTIVRYEPYVIVNGGNASEVEKIKERLIESGVATYAVPNGQSLVVSLRSGKDALDAAQEFEYANASVLATASISTAAKLKVEGTDITTTVDGTSFSMQMRPIFEEGSVAPATFVASVQNGVIVQLGNFALLPDYQSGVVAQAALVEQKQADLSVEVAWQNRSAAKAIAVSQGAAYKEKSYIIVPQGASQAQMSAIAASGKDYITGVQLGIISVSNGFVDRLRAEGDLANAGLAGEFPVSIALFSNQSGNESVVALAEKLNENGIESAVVSRKVSKATLPDIIENAGKKYRTGGIVVSFEQVAEAENGTVFLSLEFQSEGSSLSRLISVKQAVQNGTAG